MRDTFFWLYSTTPQVIAALSALTIAAVVFRMTKLDALIHEDETTIDIINEVKRMIHVSFKRSTIISVVAILYDIILIGLNGYACQDFFVLLSFIIINFIAISFIVTFVITVQDPDYINKASANLMKEYHTGTVSASDYIMKFVHLEKSMRQLAQVIGTNSSFPASLSQISRYLQAKEIFNEQDIKDFIQVKRLRNLILHNGKPSTVEKSIYDKLERLIRIIDKTTIL